jgi:hypothetical protein
MASLMTASEGGQSISMTKEQNPITGDIVRHAVTLFRMTGEAILTIAASHEVILLLLL